MGCNSSTAGTAPPTSPHSSRSHPKLKKQQRKGHARHCDSGILNSYDDSKKSSPQQEQQPSPDSVASSEEKGSNKSFHAINNMPGVSSNAEASGSKVHKKNTELCGDEEDHRSNRSADTTSILNQLNTNPPPPLKPPQPLSHRRRLTHHQAPPETLPTRILNPLKVPSTRTTATATATRETSTSTSTRRLSSGRNLKSGSIVFITDGSSGGKLLVVETSLNSNTTTTTSTSSVAAAAAGGASILTLHSTDEYQTDPNHPPSELSSDQQKETEAQEDVFQPFPSLPFSSSMQENSVMKKEEEEGEEQQLSSRSSAFMPAPQSLISGVAITEPDDPTWWECAIDQPQLARHLAVLEEEEKEQQQKEEKKKEKTIGDDNSGAQQEHNNSHSPAVLNQRIVEWTDGVRPPGSPADQQ